MQKKQEASTAQCWTVYTRAIRECVPCQWCHWLFLP